MTLNDRAALFRKSLLGRLTHRLGASWKLQFDELVQACNNRLKARPDPENPQMSRKITTRASAELSPAGERAGVRTNTEHVRTGTLLSSDARSPVDVDRLNWIASFVCVAEHLSFIAAAEVIGTSSSTVSRKVSQLEDALGLRLFERTTRRVSLTEAGRLYYAQCAQIFDHLADADATIAALNSEPSGNLRVSFPVAFGRLQLSSILSEFLEAYPKVRLEASFTDRFVDLIEESYDAVIRIGSLPDSTLIVRKIADNRRLVVASPSYLKRRGTPREPEDLAAHHCMIFSHYSSGSVWHLKRGKRVKEVAVSGEFRSDNSEVIHELVLRGRGIGLIASYICHESIKNGELVHLLPEWTSVPEAAVYIAYSSRRNLAPKIRVFSDFLIQKLKNVPWSTD